MRLPSEKQTCPRRGNPTAVKTVLNRRQTERGGKALWDAEQSDRHLPRCWDARVTSEPLCPREARVRALRAGKDHVRCAWRSGGGRRQAHLDALVSHEQHTGAPVLSPAPVAPEQRCRSDDERMQKHTHLARLSGSAAIPLTLVAQGTGTTTADAGRIDHAQASIGFLAPLVCHKWLIGWTAQRPVRLEGKVLPREATSFPGCGNRGLAIARGGRLLLLGLGHSGSKLGRTHRSRLKYMTQFQAQVPDPLKSKPPVHSCPFTPCFSRWRIYSQ